jgi:hypothetical protein
MSGCTAAVAMRNSTSREPEDLTSDDDSDHQVHQRRDSWPVSSPNVAARRSFESRASERTDNATHPIESIQRLALSQDEVTVTGFDLNTPVRKESLAEIERQRKAALTIQESFRRKRYERCLKRPLLAERLLFDAQLARGARRLLIHLATFAAYLASLDLSSNGLAK